MWGLILFVFFFFFNDTATTEIYTLSLHDALPISRCGLSPASWPRPCPRWPASRDRKSTRLNSSHPSISYAVFCLKKKKHNPMESTETHEATANDKLDRSIWLV